MKLDRRWIDDGALSGVQVAGVMPSSLLVSAADRFPGQMVVNPHMNYARPDIRSALNDRLQVCK